VWRADFDIEDPSHVLGGEDGNPQAGRFFSNPLEQNSCAQNFETDARARAVTETAVLYRNSRNQLRDRSLLRRKNPRTATRRAKIKQTAAATVPASLEPLTVETINATTPNTASQVIEIS